MGWLFSSQRLFHRGSMRTKRQAQKFLQIKMWQKAFIRDIQHSTNNDIVQPNDEQLFAPLQGGGVGLFSPCQHAWRNLGQLEKQQDSSHDWQCSLSKSVCESLKTKYPILGVQLHQHLLIDDHAFSSFLALLLGTCTPQRLVCGIDGTIIDEPKTSSGARRYAEHILMCPCCSVGLKTFRHDQVNDAFAGALRDNGVAYAQEPKGWPLRTKPSNSGHDGPMVSSLLTRIPFGLTFQFATEARMRMTKSLLRLLVLPTLRRWMYGIVRVSRTSVRLLHAER